VGQDFLDRLDAVDLYLTHVSQESGNTIVLLDLETTKCTLDSMVVDADVHLRLHAYVIAASVQVGRVTDLEFAHPGGRTAVAARTFILQRGRGAARRRRNHPKRSSPTGRRPGHASTATTVGWSACRSPAR
jgi:hypothetical protein